MARIALVTGASSGIGEMFARRLARDGYRLILVARRIDKLRALSAELGSAEILPADLTREKELCAVEERVRSEPELEMVVNNAGFGAVGRFYEVPLDSQDRMHRLHVMATMRLTHAALAAMVPRDKGAVINVSSVASFGQSAGSVTYCATKAWVTSFTQGIDLDLKSARSAVKVQALCPGFTYSEFHDVIGMDRGRIPGWLWLKAEDVVDISLAALEHDKTIVITGGIYKAVVLVERVLPTWVMRRLSLRYARRLGRGGGKRT